MSDINKIKLTEVKPSGFRESQALICCAGGRSELKVVRMPVYLLTNEAVRLKALRTEQGLLVRKAAQRCGLTACQYCGLEEGSIIPSRFDDWSVFFERIQDTSGIHGSN